MPEESPGRAPLSALTSGVRVSVVSQYVPEQSEPGVQRYVFAYTVRIGNESARTVQLRSRHWIVTHGDGHVEEVRGPGVVGEQPILEPHTGFEYTSGCILRTPCGTMRGTYQMVDPQGRAFEAEIPEFRLEMPYALN